jgi:hypothetical protein
MLSSVQGCSRVEIVAGKAIWLREREERQDAGIKRGGGDAMATSTIQ